MKKNGFVLSTYIYMLLVFFLLLLVVMLSVLSNTKVLSKKLKENATEKSALKSSSFSLVLLGDKDFVVREDDEFTDPGVIAKTKDGKDLTGSVLITSNVDTSVEGEYQVTYRLSYNGLTKEVVRNVIVGKTTIIVLDANGGTSELDYKTILKNDYVGELPIPTYSEKTFLGWYTGLTNGEIVTDNTTLGDADIITLYAHWVKSKFTYDYTGDVQVFTAPIDGYYRLNVWGAQGGSYNEIYHGGYGGYSTGIVRLDEGEELYVYVGGKPEDTSGANGGYNGGGKSTTTASTYFGMSGGGATHIATASGVLSTLFDSVDDILIVAGGGGGAAWYPPQPYFSTGGDGGGFIGNSGTSTHPASNNLPNSGGTQSRGGYNSYTSGLENAVSGSFGQGGAGTRGSNYGNTGGGGGFYGGSGGPEGLQPGGGGSAYIGNVLLYSKTMYCYNCTESSDVSTKTVSTTCVSAAAKSNCSKQGDGYAMIEYVKTTEEDVLKETPFEFDYSGDVQVFTAPIDGYYRLNAWGAQGGGHNSNNGGYGGYSTGVVRLGEGDKLYVYVGGKGQDSAKVAASIAGGYNGGGNSYGTTSKYLGSGGGATHIATVSGILSSLSEYAGNNNSPIMIVAGGGGAGGYESSSYSSYGGNGGGLAGNISTTNNTSYTKGMGGTQTSAGTGLLSGSFGQGGIASSDGTGGGGGYYGGGAGQYTSGGGGGSGYIGNELLYSKVMYCYNCTESEDKSTKTISTICASATATKNCSKQGNGYVKIEYLGITEEAATRTPVAFEYTGDIQIFAAPSTGYYKLETWGAQGGGKDSTGSTNTGGYGGYSTGFVYLNENDKLYINVGGMGGTCLTSPATTFNGGYNGGGGCGYYGSGTSYNGAGGGATHIATTSGLLSSFSSNTDFVLIVAGGGGGAAYSSVEANFRGNGGSGGGIYGMPFPNCVSNSYCPAGGSQSSGGLGDSHSYSSAGVFGGSGNINNTGSQSIAGGGGGWYGGGNGGGPAAGGSGYIGNSLLSNKVMYCYNCTESSDVSTKTVSTTCVSATATANCSKQGNGYAKITYIGD